MTVLTKRIKDQLTQNLIAKASQKKSMSARIVAENITKSLHDLIMQTAVAHVPALSAERWKELIEDGVVNDRPERIVFTTVTSETAGLGSCIILIPDDYPMAQAREVLVNLLTEWNIFACYVDVLAIDNGWRIEWVTTSHVLPHIPNTYRVFPKEHPLYENTYWNNRGIDIHNSARNAIGTFCKTFYAALEYKADLDTFFNKIRNLKQLREQFPEAVALLPSSVDTSEEVILRVKPTTPFVKSLKKRLMEGIPN